MPVLDFSPMPPPSAFKASVGGRGEITLGAIQPIITKASYLESIKMFPTDGGERENFLKTLAAAGWADALQTPSMSHYNLSAAAASSLATTPQFDKESKRRLRIARERGRITGFMLYFILQCSHAENTKKFASISAASRMVNKLKIRPTGFDVKTVKRFIWDPYESVAHLWAASWAWRLERRIDRDCWIGDLDDSSVDQLIALAEIFRNLGERWSHKNGPPVLDPAKMWRASSEASLPTLCYCFYPPHESLLKAAVGERV